MAEIDVAAATAALEQAGINPMDVSAQRDDPFAVTPPAPAASAEPVTPAPVAGEGTPPAEPVVEKTTEQVLEEFTNIPDEALTEAQIQMKRSLQADYTVKQQEAAPWRKLGKELGVDNPEDLRAVIDTARQLQDPNNWEKLHEELTAHLMSEGRISRPQAQVQAADQMAAFAPVEEDPDMGSDPDADPAIAALMKQVHTLSQTVQQDRADRQKEQAQFQQQREYDALATKLTADENRIKAANPHYSDTEIGAIYKFLGPDMDMDKARNEYESVIGSIAKRYIEGKGTTAHEVPTPVPGAGVTATAVDKPLTMEEGHARAMAWAAAADQAE